MVFLFWVIVVVWAVFAYVGPFYPEVGKYGWFPTLVLFIILGYKVFGFPH